MATNFLTIQIKNPKNGISNYTFGDCAQNERISNRPTRATAHGYMIINLTFCVLTTSTRARINTFISYASAILRAVIVQYTFWSTTNVRVSSIFWETCTNSTIAACIRTTG